MIRCLMLLSSLLILFVSQAQQLNVPHHNPISISLYRTLEQADPNEVLHLLVKGDMSQIEIQAGRYEATVKYAYNDIGAIEIPASQVEFFAKLPAVQYLDDGQAKGMLLNDAMRKNTNVDSVHAGYAPLPDSIQGEGVILAFLDTGIELKHPDFWNADSTTRVKYIWDQTSPNGPNTPTKYGYGQVWDSTDIDDGNCPHKDDHGHGTRVAGIASGNGQTAEDYKGVAPKSDIIIVEIDLTANNFFTKMTDAIDFVLDKADQMGKPVVINASLGAYVGSHDGQDLTAQLIDNMLKAKPGRAMVCAAGNGGDTQFHLGYPLTSDTTFTWFNYHNSLGYAYLQMWADTAEFNKARFGVGINRNTDFAYLDATPLRNPLNDFSLDIGSDKKTDTLKNANGQRLATVDIYGSRMGKSYVFDVVVYMDSTNYYPQLATTGEGRFDVWSDPSLTGTSNLKRGGLPDASVYPDIVHYRVPDSDLSLVSSWACSPNVISVGNFVNRNQYPNWRGDTTYVGLTVGELEVSSSRGPTRSGLIKPDITSSGQVILSPAPIWLLNSWKNSLKTNVSPEGWHARFGATSAASPIVAGVVALYFQVHPDADYQEVIDALHATAKQDTFTGFNLPNNTWGYGKVDAFSMVTAIRGCMDTAALNYNPNAVIEGDTCIYEPIGGILIGNEPTIPGFRVFPNPAHDYMWVELDIPVDEQAEIQVMNATGQVVSVTRFDRDRHGIIRRNNLPNGLYMVSLYIEGQWKGTRKILLN